LTASPHSGLVLEDPGTFLSLYFIRKQIICSFVRNVQILPTEFKKSVPDETTSLIQKHGAEFKQYDNLIKFILHFGGERISENHVKMLVNGKEKFPEVLKVLETARHYVHMKYYDWENDVRGNQIKEILLNKVGEGVVVRILFDDYASRGTPHNIVRN
jgi:cardiolipin synthase